MVACFRCRCRLSFAVSVCFIQEKGLLNFKRYTLKQCTFNFPNYDKGGLFKDRFCFTYLIKGSKVQTTFAGRFFIVSVEGVAETTCNRISSFCIGKGTTFILIVKDYFWEFLEKCFNKLIINKKKNVLFLNWFCTKLVNTYKSINYVNTYKSIDYKICIKWRQFLTKSKRTKASNFVNFVNL